MCIPYNDNGKGTYVFFHRFQYEGFQVVQTAIDTGSASFFHNGFIALWTEIFQNNRNPIKISVGQKQSI